MPEVIYNQAKNYLELSINMETKSSNYSLHAK